MARLERKHSLATRLFHWINAPVLAVMIWSGLLIYWANSVYAIRLGGFTLLKFFPAWFYSTLGVEYRLAEGMAWHFTFMWFFAINGLLYVAYTAWSGEWRHLLPNRHTFAEAWQVVRHDLGLRNESLPRRKFNAAQRLAYTGVVAMGAGSLLTGLAIFKPVQFAWLAALCGGYPAASLEHFATGRRIRRLLCDPHRSGRPRLGGTISARWSSAWRPLSEEAAFMEPQVQNRKASARLAKDRTTPLESNRYPRRAWAASSPARPS